jgi:adenylate kinase
MSNPPKKKGVCDKCDGELYQRDDDKEETIQKRFEVYRKETEPLKDYYQKNGKLNAIKGDGGIQEIFSRITNLIT